MLNILSSLLTIVILIITWENRIKGYKNIILISQIFIENQNIIQNDTNNSKFGLKSNNSARFLFGSIEKHLKNIFKYQILKLFIRVKEKIIGLFRDF